jgi:hypothetical protein
VRAADANLASLTDGELAEFYEATLDGTRGHVGDAFYRNVAFAAEIDRRVSENYGKED